MSNTLLLRRLTGSSFNSLLWRLLAACLILGAVLPQTRQLYRMVAAPGPVVRLLNGDQSAMERLRSRAKQINQPWAWMALGERVTPPDRLGQMSHAASLAPGDEAIAIRHAVAAADQATEADPPAPHHTRSKWLGPAARHACEVAPDNAVGWYLRAVDALRGGDRATAMDLLRRGNAAPRYDDHTRDAYNACARLSEASGVPDFESWFLCMWTQTFPHLAAYRELARGLTAPGATLADRLEVASFGARLRDNSVTVITVLVGQAVQQIAFAKPAASPAKSGGTKTKEQQEADRRRIAQAFADELRAAGRTDAARWVEAQLARNIAARDALAKHRQVVILQTALDPHLAAYGAWSAWMAVCVLAALALLAWTAFIRRNRGNPAGMAWRARDLLTLWLATLLPFAAISGLLAQRVSMLTIAHLFGTVGPSSPAPIWPLLASSVLPLCCTLALLRAVSSAYRRRGSASSPMDAASFDRAAARSLLLPTAALLLLCAWTALWPCVYHRQAVVSYLRANGFDETTAIRSAMDAAHPAGAPPRSALAE